MAKIKPIIVEKNRFFLFKRIVNLIANRAPIRQFHLEIGAYFLKKGCNYKVGQIIAKKRLYENTYRVKVITGLYYDFHTNKINHTSENRIAKGEKGR